LARARAWIEILLVALLSGLFVGRTFLPAWRTLNTDFPNYYIAARLYSEGVSLTRVYDWIWFQRQKDHLGIEKRIVGFVPFTLDSIIPIIPFSSMPALQAKRCWLVINLLLLALSVFLLCKMTHLGGLRTLILVFLALEPLHTQFLYGQLHMLVLLLIVSSFWLYTNNRPTASGVALSLASAFKIYPILFVFYFVRKKQWRALLGLAGGSLLLALLSIVLFGMEVNREYLQQILPRIARGEGLDPYNVGWNSFTALFRRLFVFEPQLNPHPVVNMPMAYVVLQPIIQGLLSIPLLWLLTPHRSSVEKEAVEYGTYIVALLLLSTHPASYHYVVLIACAVLVTDRLLRSSRKSEALLLVALYILACLPIRRITEVFGELATLTNSSRLVFTTALFVLLLSILGSLGTQTWRQRLRSRSALVFVPIFVVVVSASWIDNFQHFSDRNNGTRIAIEFDSLMMSHPSISESNIAFTKLQPPVYAIGTIIGKDIASFTADSDLFHPAVIPHSSQAMVELSNTTSSIVRIDLDRPLTSERGLPVEVENGEFPVVSADGRWLLFLREEGGRGGLWVKGLRGGQTVGLTPAELKLAGTEYDVLEASFDPKGSEVVFAAQPRGKPALFTIERSSSVVSQITFESASRYPAISPDGEWLAYAKLHKRNWQIWIRSRHPGTLNERQLTRGDCNSITPAWTSDSKELIYATDCGRGVKMTALARIRAVP
jgi:hypothetical protein